MPGVFSGEVYLPHLLHLRRDGRHRLRSDLHAGRHRRRVLLREVAGHRYRGSVVWRGCRRHRPPHNILGGLRQTGLEEYLQTVVHHVRAGGAVFHGVQTRATYEGAKDQGESGEFQEARRSRDLESAQKCQLFLPTGGLW